jgi:hypothetical protein
MQIYTYVSTLLKTISCRIKKKVLTTCTSDNSINTHKQMIKELIVVGSKQQVLTEVTGITAVLGTFELKTTNNKMSQEKEYAY